jgi:hypothetical protein
MLGDDVAILGVALIGSAHAAAFREARHEVRRHKAENPGLLLRSHECCLRRSFIERSMARTEHIGSLMPRCLNGPVLAKARHFADLSWGRSTLGQCRPAFGLDYGNMRCNC